MIPLLLALTLPSAQAAELSVGLSPSAQLHTGPKALAVGMGPMLSLRWHATPQLSAQLELGGMSYGPSFFQAELGGLYTFRPEATWRPAVGAEVASTWGGVTRIITDVDAWPRSFNVLVGARALLRPISAQTGPWTISALTLSVGAGLEAPGRTLSVGVDLLTLERRL